MQRSTRRHAALLASFLAGWIGLSQGQSLESKDMTTFFQRIQSRVPELSLTMVHQTKSESFGCYKRQIPEAERAKGNSRVEINDITVLVEPYDSVEAAEQGVKTSIILTPVRHTSEENIKGIRTYIWDSTGSLHSTGFLRFLFRLDKDVINISWRDQKTFSRDSMMAFVDVVRDELQTTTK